MELASPTPLRPYPKRNYSRNTQVYVNAFADIKLWKGLVFRTEYAANFNYSNDYKLPPPTTTSTSSSSRQQAVGAGSRSNWTLKTYFIIIPSANTASLPCWDTKRKKTSTSRPSGSRTNFLFNSVHELDAVMPQQQKANSSRGSSAIESILRPSELQLQRPLLADRYAPCRRFVFVCQRKSLGLVPFGSIGLKVNNEAFLKMWKPSTHH